MISTHILDTTLGSPARDVSVSLSKKNDKGWMDLGKAKTNADGRVVFDVPAEEGVYKLKFGIEEYFKRNKQDHFFQNVRVIFNVSDTQRKYHVPLLLNPYGYSTYRGS